jgi:PadR family transcriptional regulator, regulatory protein PadR
MSRKPRVLSDPAAMILRRFVDDPDAELHGFQIIRETGIPSSTLYPALRSLSEDRGYLTSRHELLDPSIERRPARRLYRLDLNPAAALTAREALAEHAEHKRRVSARGSASLRPGRVAT